MGIGNCILLLTYSDVIKKLQTGFSPTMEQKAIQVPIIKNKTPIILSTPFNSIFYCQVPISCTCFQVQHPPYALASIPQSGACESKRICQLNELPRRSDMETARGVQLKAPELIGIQRERRRISKYFRLRLPRARSRATKAPALVIERVC
jgi:hypothetical protein